MKPWTFFLLVLLGLALTLNFCRGQTAPPPPPLTAIGIVDGKTNLIVWNGAVVSQRWESAWITNIVLMAIETNQAAGYMRVMRPATLEEIAGTGWFSNGIPGIHPLFDTNENLIHFRSPIIRLTNSYMVHPERKIKVLGYKKECPECGVMLTSTNITTWSVNDDTNSFRMVSVQFECRGCEETYLETFKRPIRKTKVEELTVEVVK